MKRYSSAAMVLLGLLGMTTTVNASQCRINGGEWRTFFEGGGGTMTVPVTVRLGSDPTRIILEGVRLECRFTPLGIPTREDYWETTTMWNPLVWGPGPKFTNQATGLRINGTYRNSPVPNAIRIATMPDNSMAYPIDVTPYILIRNDPSNPIDVRAGDHLGTLNLRQTNNYSSNEVRLLIRYTSANDFGISPSTCTINNNNPITIDFGSVNQRAIGTDPLTTAIRADRRLTYNCPGSGLSMPITITYQGIPSAFSPNLLTMSNPDVGTALLHGGTAVRVGGSFLTRINNGAGQDDVTFSLVSRAGSPPAAGPISGSGVLVMGVP